MEFAQELRLIALLQAPHQIFPLKAEDNFTSKQTTEILLNTHQRSIGEIQNIKHDL